MEFRPQSDVWSIFMVPRKGVSLKIKNKWYYDILCLYVNSVSKPGIWCNVRSSNIWIWISKSLVDRSTPLKDCGRLQCLFPREGDMVLLDNYLVMHGRCPFEGTRLHAVSWFKSQMLRALAENEDWGNHNDSSCLKLRPWLFKSCSLMETCRLQAMLISFAKQTAANLTIAMIGQEFWTACRTQAGHDSFGWVYAALLFVSFSHAWISLKCKLTCTCGIIILNCCYFLLWKVSWPLLEG